MADEQMISKEQFISAMDELRDSIEKGMKSIQCFADLLDIVDGDNSTYVPAYWVGEVLKGLIQRAEYLFVDTHQEELKRVDVG